MTPKKDLGLGDALSARLGKTPTRFAQSAAFDKFTKTYKKDELALLRMALQDLTAEEAESLPFGLQSELMKLGEVCNDKFNKRSRRY